MRKSQKKGLQRRKPATREALRPRKAPENVKPQKVRRRPTRYQKKAKPPLVPSDPDVVTRDAILRCPEGWYPSVLDLRQGAEAGMVPPPFAALGAIRWVVEGLVHLNEMLPDAGALPLPKGAKLVSAAPPPASDATDFDPFDGRKEDDLIPIPYWAAVFLTMAHREALSALSKRKSVDLNDLFGVAGRGRGNRGFLNKTPTRTLGRRMAIAVCELLGRSEQPSLEQAVTIVGMSFGRDPSVVRHAYHEHSPWAKNYLKTKK